MLTSPVQVKGGLDSLGVLVPAMMGCKKKAGSLLRKSDAAPGRSLVTSAPGDRLIRSLPGVFVDARPPGPVASVRDGREVPAPRDRASPHGMHTLHTLCTHTLVLCTRALACACAAAPAHAPPRGMRTCSAHCCGVRAENEPRSACLYTLHIPPLPPYVVCAPPRARALYI